MLRKTSLVFALVLLVPGVLAAAGEGHAHGKPAQRVDKELLTMRLRQATRQSRGKGIDTDSDEKCGEIATVLHFLASGHPGRLIPAVANHWHDARSRRSRPGDPDADENGGPGGAAGHARAGHAGKRGRDHGQVWNARPDSPGHR